MLRLCQDGTTLLDYFVVKLYFGIVCGQTVVPQEHIVSKKISSALTGRHNRVFWQEIKKGKRSKTAKHSQSSIVDGFTNMRGITSNFHNKLSTVLNSIEEDVASFSFLQDSSCTANVSIVTETVSDAL